MKTQINTIAALASGAILLSGVLSQTAQASVESGSAQLADVLGVDTGPESLTVSYLVTLSAGVYTYTYSVFNPAGDVLLNTNGLPTATPEVVDAFSVGFDTTQPGAFIAGSQTGGLADLNDGVAGLFWAFTGVNPSNSSPTLSFESDLPPVMGNAGAQDANPPSPWASNPDGQDVPVPNTALAPDSTSTLALFGGVLLLLPFRSILKKAGRSR